ncbi:hypothetical protein Q8A67_010170 [Cirrhinus molitorella]|uniref:Uncharacterized protein n=1 Tax=Cirrhinus molitorella TaxID=172907 RepID=A0AA88Q0Z4_9TELE|nr:hypothetical protein Q8A67_010170 [Cirrhinus molitorella]
MAGVQVVNECLSQNEMCSLHLQQRRSSPSVAILEALPDSSLSTSKLYSHSRSPTVNCTSQRIQPPAWLILLRRLQRLQQHVRFPCRHSVSSTRANFQRANFSGNVSNPAPPLVQRPADEAECPNCKDMSLASLRSRLALFSEHDPAPRALPLSSSQEPARTKQWGRGSRRLVSSKLTSAQPPRASLSPQREASPVLFSRLDQRPCVAASNLVSFGGSEDEMLDDSMSLAASDAEDLSGSAQNTALLPSAEHSAAGSGMDAELFRILTKDLLSVVAGLHKYPQNETIDLPQALAYKDGMCDSPKPKMQ